jgi:hypothetical protein
MPDSRELTRWYLFSLGALAAAVLLAGMTHATWRLFHGKWQRLPTAVVFFTGLFVFGIAATPLANRYCNPFVFTWPLSLLAVHQIALAAVSRPKPPQSGKRTDWPGIAGAGLLVLTCVVYYKLTRQLNMSPAWHFLALLPAAWPLAVPAARRLCRPARLTGDILWMFAVFSLYFWAAGGVMLLRTACFDRR